MKIKINPDKEYVSDVRRRLKDNDGYCPCVITKRDEDKCMCKSFREQSEEGYCHCGLYYKTDGDKVLYL